MDLPLEFVEKFCQKEKANRIYHFPGEAWSQVQGGVRNDWWPCLLVIRIGNRKYEFSGYGSSKKTAKIAAAQRAVKILQSVYGGPGTGGHSGASAGGGASGTIPGAGAGVLLALVPPSSLQLPQQRQGHLLLLLLLPVVVLVVVVATQLLLGVGEAIEVIGVVQVLG